MKEGKRVFGDLVPGTQTGRGTVKEEVRCPSPSEIVRLVQNTGAEFWEVTEGGTRFLFPEVLPESRTNC